ncbi:DUF3558 family protein [Mycobacteroides abscessus]|uniref:DUF3558 family protein n=1 Tax=Mycobacteroides abscessus TaxID=36809 RepID=UPI000927A6C4|nr:DUF3558 family protein [Mycobacteroides abscessus]SKS29677.1 Protein of uncharacterised function (DUF3558) [Mycobacteroides abscessus subsp. abscessus]SHV18371.1 Protein of uncharacterised function (DUF3558) [Mycobacteroides abscessus subsp. bolletii]SHX77884.1 Protein of uncharacterised function (DUF3558) [Mycobacteroides abscessus subsp. bolletii]SHX82761.1 Protein of uncharacterised function (DUF3558) [Mycobacteroides abscessus subsp. bolletii]SHY31123.1 Protein of uncharacterised functi
MKLRWIVLVAAALALVAGCTHDRIQGTTGEDSGSSSSISPSSSTSTSPATTSTDGVAVKGTAFDACTAITDADVSGWKVDPTNKRDAHQTAFGQRVRGCIWGGPDWFIKIYAVDTSISQLAQPNDRWDRHEQVTVGARSGWLIHNANGASCSVTIPSQQAVASVQVDLKTELTEQRYDQCPLALQIMKQIEPKIP